MGDVMTTVLAVAGGISVIGGAWAVVAKWIKPATQLVQRVKALEEHDKRDYETMKRLGVENRLTLKAMMLLLQHEIEGNHVDKLAEQLAEIENYLIDK